MTLEAKLRDIQKKLEDNRNFPNESSISQGIVLPILQELNWDIFDTKVVCPEWRIPGLKPRGKGNTARVDFALFKSPDTPAKVFIEVKARGFENDPKPAAETQLFTYANAGGIPLAVLTDGGTWSFYLPAEAVKSGSSGLKGRQVFELDISKSSSFQESSEVLQRYLEKNRVVSDEAHETARVIFLLEKFRNRTDLKWVSVNEEIKKFKEGYSMLANLAKSIKPNSAQDNFDHDFVVHSLLRQEISPSTSGTTAQRTQPEPGGKFPAPSPSGASERKQPVHRRVRQVPAPPPSGASGSSPSEMLVILDKAFPCKSATDAMIEVFKELERREQGFYQRFYNSRWNRGKTRQVIAQDPRELYDDPSLKENPYASRPLSGGWFIATNNSKSTIERHIRKAAEVAGLKFGRDIIINFDA